MARQGVSTELILGLPRTNFAIQLLDEYYVVINALRISRDARGRIGLSCGESVTHDLSRKI